MRASRFATSALRWKALARAAAMLGGFVLGFGACSYDDGTGFGAGDDDDDIPGGSSGRKPGDPPPITCGDGRKNGDESDVDCGGSCDTRCAVGQGCKAASDCADQSCQGGTCQAPSSTDKIKNGDESDVDCGGSTTNAPPCLTGKTCNLHSDCESNGCGMDGRCADAPSCIVHLGGDTCGTGEVGSGSEVHESCCTSDEVPGYNDPNHPGMTVLVDRYEITAGRMREFIRRVAEANGGQPDIRGWIQNNRPTVWNDGWTALLPADYASEDYGVYAAFNAFGEDNQGFHIHAMNCHMQQGTHGHPTYWFPPEVIQQYGGGQPRAYSQDELDVKAMNCMTYPVAAAFCAWDGGQLATFEALSALTQNSSLIPALPAGTAQIYRDGGNAYHEPLAYEYPREGTSADAAGRMVPPGRLSADVVERGGGKWFDLRGNVNEMVMSSDAGSVRLMNDDALGNGSRSLGIGYYSALVNAGGNINNSERVRRPHYKSALSGARCMRFR